MVTETRMPPLASCDICTLVFGILKKPTVSSLRVVRSNRTSAELSGGVGGTNGLPGSNRMPPLPNPKSMVR